jgi:UDP-N-acetylmuramyl pentapeptide phosphotransferase/UDP-N-acetylglucosamine-1-phosphate transferase
MPDFALYAASLVLGGVGAWFVSRWGKPLGLLDRPNERSSHDGVVPKGGGIGILAAFLVASWTVGLPGLTWVCVGLISLLSLYGDRREIPPKVRLSVQFLGSVGLLFALFYWVGRGWPVFFLIPVLSIFVVGTANYYNFMDGINGIAGITGIVGFGLLAWFTALSGSPPALMMLAVCMVLACVGFLPFNMPKARVFMGDVGSVLLGFVYASFAVSLSHNLNDFLVLCAFLFPFYADELTTEYVRLRDGENLLRPHRRHFYQLMANEKGIAHWKVSVGYGVLQLVVGVSVLLIKSHGVLAVVVLLAGWFGGFAGVSFYFRKRLEN